MALTAFIFLCWIPFMREAIRAGTGKRAIMTAKPTNTLRGRQRRCFVIHDPTHLHPSTT